MAGTYKLRRRWRSHDFDIVNGDDDVRGQVIVSPAGCTVYLIGEFKPLGPAQPDAAAALQSFVAWTVNNTTSVIPIIRKRDGPN